MNNTQIRLVLFSLSCLILAIGLHYRNYERVRGPRGQNKSSSSIWNHTVSMLMVKNEALIIERAIVSLQKHVGRYVFLCDTGSSDDTVARALEATLPNADTVHYTLVEGFKHFEQARNACREALGNHTFPTDVHIEWVALPDADFEARVSDATPVPDYDVNTIQIHASRSGMPHNSLHLLVRASTYFAQCRYRLWTHEFLSCSGNASFGFYNGFQFVDHEDGTSRSSKLERDKRLLHDWLVQVNETELRPRALYYLARAYEDSQQLDLALHTYRRHAAEQTHTNYIFYGAYRVALITLRQWSVACNANATRCASGLPAVETAFMRAFHTYDGYFRREIFYYLALTHRRLGHYHECLLYAAAALQLPAVDHSRIPLMIELEVYGSELQAEYDFCVAKLKAW